MFATVRNFKLPGYAYGYGQSGKFNVWLCPVKFKHQNPARIIQKYIFKELTKRALCWI